MPQGKDAPGTLTDTQNRALNPTNNVAGGLGGTIFVSITGVNGKVLSADDVLNALRTAFGTTKVVSRNPTVARNNMNLEILP